MGFISKLLHLFSGSTKTASTRSASLRKNATRNEHNVALNKGWLTLTQPYFFGRAHCSPNRRWVVGYSDPDGAGRGGHRESGYGRVVLVHFQLLEPKGAERLKESLHAKFRQVMPMYFKGLQHNCYNDIRIKKLGQVDLHFSVNNM